ncbi:MAG: hypothetical protein EHM41_08115 [Chloroflexi bacterium]|nr:MAG: hypothetical protein EHM41_08115 [Chloroflexota bacterium]
MDHVVYVDAKESELEKLINGTKTAILRGATGRKIPYGRLNPGDCLYFIRNNSEGLVHARADVKAVMNSEALTPKMSVKFVEENQEKLQFTPNQMRRWAGKRYLVLIDIGAVEKVEPFPIDKSSYGNMDDWLPVGNIETVKVTAV